MYEKLLISAGGGIISTAQQAEQDQCATIAIGLGGTGISCLRTLKKEIFTRVKPDAANALVAQYRHIKFLAVDTDKSSLGDTGAVDTIDSNTEFFNISCANITTLLSSAHLLQQDSSLHWLKTAATQGDGSGITILSADAGAGGVRQIGRLLLLRSCKAFVRKLTDIITEARKDLIGDYSVNIHIFTGLGGGTGAGTFLDVCYILQHVLNQLGLAGQAFTCGYFFLPDVNIAKGVNNDYIPLNGFASMKELDYAMNYSNNGGQWDQQYDGFRVTTQNPPVRLAHLITATNADGAIRTNGYEYAMHVAVDYVLEYIIKPFISDGDDVDNDGVFSIRSHISNVNRLIEGVQKKHGACYNYCILGAANAYLPYKEITTYLASKIFEGFGKLVNRMPFDSDIDAFLLRCSLKYEDITRALATKLPNVPNYAVDHKTLYEQVEGLTPDSLPTILTQMRDSTTAISGKLAENKAAMLDTTASTVVGQTNMIVSLHARVMTELLKDAADPSKGPYYAAGILHSLNSHDLINKLQNYITQTTEHLIRANADLTLRDQALANTLRELQNSNKLNRKSRAQDYVNAVHSYFVQRCKIEQLQVLGDLLNQFIKQMESLYTGFFGIFANVMQNLQSTFEANLRSLAEPVMEDHGYALKLMSIQELQASLDSAVGAMRIDDQIQSFVRTMLATPDIWIAQDANKISAAVSNYFLNQLSSYTNMTIVDYLQVKFNTKDPARLQRKVYDEIIMPLGDRSAPLFWTDTSVFSLEDAQPLGYLSIPSISDEIKAAAADYMSGHSEIKVRKAWAQDRITIFHFRCGIPMYAYKGVGNYKSAYRAEAHHNIGSHLYEGSTRDPRNSQMLIDISPISCVHSSELTPKEKDNIVLYQKAWDAHIITKTAIGANFEYRINLLDTAALTARKQAAEKILAAGAVAEAKQLLEEIERDPLPIASYRVIPNNGYGDYAPQVIQDHVVGSQLNMSIIGEQLAHYEQMHEAEVALRSLSSKADDFNNDILTFSKALVTGTIERVNAYTYTYTKETFGIKESIDLTTVDSEPYGMTLQIYSAFIGFQKLDKATKDEIATATKRRLVDDEAVNAALASLQQTLSDEKINALAGVAKTSYPENAKEIINFLMRLSKEVKNFAAAR